MLVKDILESKDRKIVTAQPTTTVSEAMDILISNKISCLPILDEAGKLKGIVSDKDIFKLVFKTQDDFADVPISDIMTANLIVGVADDEIDYIAGIMTENRIRHVPIVDKETMIGLVSQGDVIKKQMKHIQIENRYLKMYIDGGPVG